MSAFPDLGPNDHEMVVALRASCLLYTSLVLSASACDTAGETVSTDENEMMTRALIACAHAGHAVVEASRARHN